MVDKWIKEATGFSALARFGRDFQTDEDVERWLAEPGGIAVAVNRVMRAGGFPKTGMPIDGDVGLVFHQGVHCMAICAQGHWVGRTESGMFATSMLAMWKAWEVSPCRA